MTTHTGGAGRLLALAFFTAFLWSGHSAAAPLSMPGVDGTVHVVPPPGSYRTSWVGNTFGGNGGPNGFGSWVQGGVGKLVVTPDGTAVCGVSYDEAGRCIGLYKNGQVNRVLLQEHGVQGESAWGWGTANNGVAADGPYLYLANVGKKLLRFRWTPGDLDSAQYVDEVDMRANATGLTARRGRIAVCDATGIELRDAADLHVTGGFALAGAKDAVFASDGSLWVLTDTTVRHVAADGHDLGGLLTGLQDPTAVAWDNHDRLIVCDNGPRQQVLFYDVSGTPRLVSTFGEKGGLSSGIPGQVAPRKLFGLRGAGTDAQGNLYVAMSLSGGTGGGCFLRSFTPAGALRWEVQGAAFVDTFGFDPDSDGSVVYSRYARFDLDFNKPRAGSEWRLSAITLPYPAPASDTRMTPDKSVIVRRLQGRRLLYMIGQYGGGYHLYAFDSAQGNLAQEAGNIGGKDTWAWDVDSRGDIWNGDALGKTIRRYAFGGWTPDGKPKYDWDHPQTWSWPSDFALVRRIHYTPETDTLYLFGYLNGQNIESWGVAGRAARRYDGWIKGAQSVRWTIPELPLNPTGSDDHKPLTPNGVEVCGDYLFVGMVKPEDNKVYVHILRLSDGQYIGSLAPGPEVGEGVGWEDMPYATSVIKRRSGEYLILVEEDWRSKNLLYYWKP